MRTKEEIQEGQKYDILYANRYPAGGVGWPLKWSGKSIRNLRVLDIGCGHGLLAGTYSDYTGIDVSEYIVAEASKKKTGRFLVCGALDAYEMFQNEMFDLVLALDVLEHFPRANLEEYLEKISRVRTKEFLFAICCRESGYRDTDGKSLHLSVMNKDEWMCLLSKYFTIHRSSELNAKKTFCVLVETKPIS